MMQAPLLVDGVLSMELEIKGVADRMRWMGGCWEELHVLQRLGFYLLETL